jgi:hypothetical protein
MVTLKLKSLMMVALNFSGSNDDHLLGLLEGRHSMVGKQE